MIYEAWQVGSDMRFMSCNIALWVSDLRWSWLSRPRFATLHLGQMKYSLCLESLLAKTKRFSSSREDIIGITEEMRVGDYVRYNNRRSSASLSLFLWNWLNKRFLQLMTKSALRRKTGGSEWCRPDLVHNVLSVHSSKFIIDYLTLLSVCVGVCSETLSAVHVLRCRLNPLNFVKCCHLFTSMFHDVPWGYERLVILW